MVWAALSCCVTLETPSPLEDQAGLPLTSMGDVAACSPRACHPGHCSSAPGPSHSRAAPCWPGKGRLLLHPVRCPPSTMVQGQYRGPPSPAVMGAAPQLQGFFSPQSTRFHQTGRRQPGPLGMGTEWSGDFSAGQTPVPHLAGG